MTLTEIRKEFKVLKLDGKYHLYGKQYDEKYGSRHPQQYLSTLIFIYSTTTRNIFPGSSDNIDAIIVTTSSGVTVSSKICTVKAAAAISRDSIMFRAIFLIF